MTRTKDFYLLLLSTALIEIRYLAVEGDLGLAPKLADILHNVPAALRFPWTEERENDLYAHMRAKAEAHGLTELLDGMERGALRNIATEASEPVGTGFGTDQQPQEPPSK